ncbi:MAG: MFS transporter, partial [Propionicimonas sp.]
DRLGSRTVITAGISVMSLGMLLLSQASASLAAFSGAGVLIGLGLASLLGAPIRYVTLNETTRQERSSAQGLVGVFTGLGQLVGSAVVGAVAASTSSTSTGYDAAFGLIGILGIMLLAAAVLLKSRAAEREPAARETSPGGQRAHA